MGVSSTTAFWNTAVVFPLTINVPGLQCSLNSLLLDDLAITNAFIMEVAMSNKFKRQQVMIP